MEGGRIQKKLLYADATNKRINVYAHFPIGSQLVAPCLHCDQPWQRALDAPSQAYTVCMSNCPLSVCPTFRYSRKKEANNFQCMRVSCMEWTVYTYASTRQKGISYFGYTRVWSRARIRGDLQIVFVASWLPVLVSEVSRQTQGRVHGVLCFG
jgi:hypothetical protein